MEWVLNVRQKIILINDHLIKVPFYMWYQTKIIAQRYKFSF